MQTVLERIADPANAIIIATASQMSIQKAQKNPFEESFPLFSPASWNISPITGARYLPEDNFLTGKVNEWLIARITDDSLEPPVLNPLIPATLRAPRIPDSLGASTISSELEEDLKVLALLNATKANKKIQSELLL